MAKMSRTTAYSNFEIHKVITVYVDSNQLDNITNGDSITSDYWMDLDDLQENHYAKALVSYSELEALENSEADFIVFRRKD